MFLCLCMCRHVHITYVCVFSVCVCVCVCVHYIWMLIRPHVCIHAFNRYIPEAECLMYLHMYISYLLCSPQPTSLPASCCLQDAYRPSSHRLFTTRLTSVSTTRTAQRGCPPIPSSTITHVLGQSTQDLVQ